MFLALGNYPNESADIIRPIGKREGLYVHLQQLARPCACPKICKWRRRKLKMIQGSQHLQGFGKPDPRTPRPHEIDLDAERDEDREDADEIYDRLRELDDIWHHPPYREAPRKRDLFSFWIKNIFSIFERIFFVRMKKSSFNLCMKCVYFVCNLLIKKYINFINPSLNLFP